VGRQLAVWSTMTSTVCGLVVEMCWMIAHTYWSTSRPSNNAGRLHTATSNASSITRAISHATITPTLHHDYLYNALPK